MQNLNLCPVLSVLSPRNLPGSHYGPQGNGTTNPTYEHPYPQPPTSPWGQPGMPMGHDTSYWQGSQQPPTGPSPQFPSSPVPPAGFLPLGVAPPSQQSPGPISASWSPFQGTHNALGGPYTPPPANESYLPYNTGGFLGQQNLPPAIPPRSQPRGTGEWDVMAGSNSHSGPSVNGSYPPHPPAGFFGQQSPRPNNMPATSPHQGVQNALGPYP